MTGLLELQQSSSIDVTRLQLCHEYCLTTEALAELASTVFALVCLHHAIALSMDTIMTLYVWLQAC